MRQRGGSEQPVKGRRANGPKARRVSTAAPSVADLQKQVGILTRERDDALEQQRAAAEVLKIISASPAEFRPVLEVIVESAARFCDADDVTILELDGQDLRTAAHRGPVPHEIGVRFPCTRGSVAGRTVIDRKLVHVIDLRAEAEEFPEGSAFARRLGHRTVAGALCRRSQRRRALGRWPSRRNLRAWLFCRRHPAPSLDRAARRRALAAQPRRRDRKDARCARCAS